MVVVIPREELMMIMVISDCTAANVLVVVVGSGCGCSNESSVASDPEVLVLGELGLGAAEVHLELAELMLEKRDNTNAAVDRVTEAHVSLVGE